MSEHVEKPYGYLVTYERAVGKGATEQATFRSKGHERVARRAASVKSGYVRVVSLDPYTEEQWLRCFGEGRM